jgi:hypothetical protein
MYHCVGCRELDDHFSSNPCFSIGLGSKTTEYLYGTFCWFLLLLLQLWLLHLVGQ